MVLTIPGGRGLFNVLQDALRTKGEQGTKIRLSSVVHLVLADFRWLATDLTRQPTRIAEIIPNERPDTIGAQDSTAMGMVGVHFVPQQDG
jgi:hypothetical protein